MIFLKVSYRDDIVVEVNSVSPDREYLVDIYLRMRQWRTERKGKDQEPKLPHGAFYHLLYRYEAVSTVLYRMNDVATPSSVS